MTWICTKHSGSIHETECPGCLNEKIEELQDVIQELQEEVKQLKYFIEYGKDE